MNGLEQVRTTWRWVVAFLLLIGGVGAGHAATLVWDANTETNLMGYNVYLSSAQAPPSVIDVGNHTNYPLGALLEGVTYTMYVTAYNTDLIESDPSESVTYTVPFLAPIITNQPVGLTVGPGSPIALFVAASGNGGRTYQWFKNGLHIDGATNATYIITSGSITDSGTYTVRVTNPGGSAMSQPAELSIQLGGAIPPPVISVQPQSISAKQGQGRQLSIQVLGGGGTLTYQWWKDGHVLFGAFGPVVNFPSISPADAGNYFVILRNANGSTISETATVTVLAAPTITSTPIPTDVGIDSTAILSVEAIGDGKLSYQWLRNGTNIPGATDSVFIISDAQLTDTGTYAVAISNDGGTTISEPVPLTVFLPPVITKDPQPTSVALGDSTALHVEVGGTAPMSFQWFKDFIPVTGGTSADLVISNADYALSGAYYVTVSNPAGEVTSATVNLAVGGPRILASPSAVVVNENAQANMNVSVEGEQPLSFQWMKDGSAVPGQTNSSLRIASARATDEGDYTVVVTNPRGSASSTPAHLTVLAPPVILVQPVSQSIKLGFPVTFSVEARGTTPLRYQWMKDGAAIAGATTNTYSIAEVVSSSMGSYSVRVSNNFGNVTSASAALTVVAVPRITVPPSSLITRTGLPLILSVTVTSDGPTTFQWLKNGEPIPGATSQSFRIPSVQTSDGGTYAVIVSNAAGSVTSRDAIVTVVEAPFVVTGPVSQTVNEGLDVEFTVEAGGTEPITYQWTKDNVALPGENFPVLHLSAVTPSAQGTYKVLISNAGGSTTAQAVLTVVAKPGKPIIVSPSPSNREVAPGARVTFVASASGSGLTFQWFKDGSPIFGAFGLYFDVASMQDSDFGVYKLRVSNAAGFTESDDIAISKLLPPEITVQPTSVTILSGQAFGLSVEASGSGILSYQWMLNNNPIQGATNALYSVEAATVADEGTYTVNVSNSVGFAVSDPATVTVRLPVSITRQPQSTNVIEGATIVLSVEAEGTPPVTFQWSRDGIPIEGATNAVLLIPNAASADSGSYSVTVSNDLASENSIEVNVTVDHAETDEKLGRLSVSSDAGNSIQFEARGLPGRTYDIQASNHLKSGSWQTIQSITVDNSGTFVIEAGSLSTNQFLFIRTQLRE